MTSRRRPPAGPSLSHGAVRPTAEKRVKVWQFGRESVNLQITRDGQSGLPACPSANVTNMPMLRKILFLLTLTLLPLWAQGQSFSFGPSPFFAPRQQTHTRVESPKFKGGDKALRRYLLKHYENPSAEDRTVEGTVVVACIIDEKGRVVETHVVRSVGEAFDREAVRVCKKMKFHPARQGKKKVKSRFDISFPIRHSRLSFVTLSTTVV